MTSATVTIHAGAVISYFGRTFCVRKLISPEEVLATDVAAGEDQLLKLSDITRSFGEAADQEAERLDLVSIPEDDWQDAMERYRALAPLLGLPSRTAAHVKVVADELLVSVATVYRWLDRVERAGSVSCLLRKRRSDAGVRRLDSRVEQVIKEVILSDYLTELKKSPTAVTRVIGTRCRSEGLPVPSKVAVLARIDAILPEERARKREGRNAALVHRAIKGSMPGVDTLYSVWQIDHTPADVMLVDEIDRIAIGKPWITMAIDVFSRMVVGWYISFDPPGALATGLCISNAILPKDDTLGRLGVNFPWVCQGKPSIIQADNAREFHGEMLQEASQEHGFDMKFRKLKKPNYGAHIERLFGTFAERIHELDGTTFSNTVEKGDYKSEKNATMTLVEFERWFANLILGEYHHDVHSTLGVPPIERYREGLFGSDKFPGLGMMRMASDPYKLRIDFMPVLRRTIQTYGVVSDFIYYHDPVLDKWIGAPEPGNKRKAREFIFRYDPRDISHLIFWDPQLRQYFRIPYRNTAYPRISLWELKAIKAFMKDRGLKLENEEQIFLARKEMQRIEEQARSDTRSRRAGKQPVETRKKRMTTERNRMHKVLPPVPLPSDRVAPLPVEPSGLSSVPSTAKDVVDDFSHLTPFEER